MPREFWARGDSSNANNASLNNSNTNKQPTTLLTFEATAGGDEKLDYNDGNPDPDTVVWADYDGDGVRDALSARLAGRRGTPDASRGRRSGRSDVLTA